MPQEIIAFGAALKLAGEKRHLLLGNGFSIALRPDIFSYSSLYGSADFSKIPYANAIFDALQTRDFEAVIRSISAAARLLSAYKDIPPGLIKQLNADAAEIKTILVQAIARNHPDRPYEVEKSQYQACRVFLSNFAHIYTLNYDVLLYWALMQREIDDLEILPDDGFRHPEDNEEAPYVSWQEAHSPTVHYLHGALHLFDAGPEIIKYTWSKTDVPLLEQIRAALDDDKYPLFVSEGDSAAKLKRILHNAYLHKSYRSFDSICGQVGASLFVFGHSLASNDAHILSRISRGRISKLFVSIFGPAENEANKQIIQAAKALVLDRAKRTAKYPLELSFFSSNTANVWGS